MDCLAARVAARNIISMINRVRALLLSVSSTSNPFAGAGPSSSIVANMATTNHHATAKKARTALDEIGVKGEFKR